MTKASMLADIRKALTDVSEPEPLVDVPTNWDYGKATAVSDAVELFVDRLIDYKAQVLSAKGAEEVPALIHQALRDAGALSCVVPAGLEASWLAEAQGGGVELLVDEPPLGKLELDGVDAVVTRCAVCMAETGTIALDHRSDQGRRIISLLPDTHVCVVQEHQIASDVPEALARLAPSIREGLPITWISGPSATSDIELTRVEGVHGPRKLYVILCP